MKYFIVSFLLSFAFFGLPFAEAALHGEAFSQLDNSERAIWKIYGFDEDINGTGFFIGANHFITNFHVVSAFFQDENIETIFLSQEGNSSVLKVKRILALSALYDLALLEVEEDGTDFLTLREHSPESNENLFVIAYPKEGGLTKMKKTRDIFYEYGRSLFFPIDKMNTGGASGSPVLDQQGQVVGVTYGASANLLSAVKINHLKEFIIGNIGRECVDSSLSPIFNGKTCVKEEMQNLEELAKEGSSYAQYELATRYYENTGFYQSFEEFLYWYKEAAEHGHTLAQYELGIQYYEGERVNQNFQEALYWFKKSAAQGYAPAQHSLAVMYSQGKGVDRNFEQALYWFEKAIRQGYAPSQANLAFMYYYGQGVEQSFEEAFHWNMEAAEQGHDLAQYKLARMYENSEAVNQNFERAFYWMEKSARGGYALAQSGLAQMYYLGKGTEQDLNKAVAWLVKAVDHGSVKVPDWYKKLAEQGYVSAQYSLAVMYYDGRGIEQNFTKAFYWMEKSAREGLALAQSGLAIMYYNGEAVNQDLSKTYYWLKEASKQDHVQAFSKLTDMVCKGEGTEEDINKAISWLKEASEQGVSGAQKCLDQLREKGIAIGAVGLLAAAGAKQAYAEGSESTAETSFQTGEGPVTQTGESISGSNMDLQMVSAASEMNVESVSQTAESASELVTEVGASIVGEIAADLALDWIPVVGFGKLGFEAIAGVHLLTGRDLTLFERAASGGGAILNLVGLGWLKNLKSLKHSKTVGQQAHKWASN